MFIIDFKFEYNTYSREFVTRDTRFGVNEGVFVV